MRVVVVNRVAAAGHLNVLAQVQSEWALPVHYLCALFNCLFDWSQKRGTVISDTAPRSGHDHASPADTYDVVSKELN